MDIFSRNIVSGPKYNKLYIVVSCWTIIDIFSRNNVSGPKYNKLYIVVSCSTIIDIFSRNIVSGPKYKIKNKLHAVICYGGTKGEYRYGFTLS